MPKQSVRVHIFNQVYTLLADDDAAEVQEIAHRIDELMVSIAGRTNSGDSTRVAVLACLHLADKLREAENKLRSYESKSAAISSLLEDALADAGATSTDPLI
jgi:cell division protein ZapA